MIPKSIRWRLPLSYAAIALLAALSLGAVLLTILRSYYARQEVAYLQGNAQEISLTLSKMLQGNVPAEAVQAQLKSMPF